MTLCHLVHYCARQGWLVLHVPDGESADLRPAAKHPLLCTMLLRAKSTGEAQQKPARFLLLPAHLWVKNCRELLQSSYNKERLDQPLQASSWLKNFKTSNERFLKEVCS